MSRNLQREKNIEEKWREARNSALIMFGSAVGALAIGLPFNNYVHKLANPDRSPPAIERSITDINYSLDPVNLPLYSVEGKLLRAQRFHHLFDHYESINQLEPGLLAGLAIQESFAEPTMLNFSNDGGVGKFQFMPGTARDYGLNVYGNSNSTRRDLSHGRQMRSLVNKYNNNLEDLIKYDDRFDPVKSTDAAARYLRFLIDKHSGNVDAAISAYNQGRPARNPRNTRHVQGVRRYQDAYLSYIQENGTQRR